MSFARSCLTIEGEKAWNDPSWPEIELALEWLNPDGPSFFVLENTTEDYVQLLGAKDQLTVEFRHWTPDGFLHGVLGRGQGSTEEVRVPSTGGGVTVFADEALNLDDARRIFGHFYETGRIPDGYAVRDTTQMFLES
jgi:hypothetical protein